MTTSNGLSKNKHFLIELMEPYIMGAEAQLGRVLATHITIKDPNRYTMTQFHIFIYELSSLLEHLNMLTRYRSNANLPIVELEKKINDFRNEIRHTNRFDTENKERSKRLGKNPNLIFELAATNTGIKIGNTNLTFNEIDLYIQQVKLELHTLLIKQPS